MQAFVPLSRRFLPASFAVAVLFLITSRAEAQGIGFQGGGTIDPEQFFVGTHFETPEIFQNFRFRPGIDGSFGGDLALAAINIEFLYYLDLGRSGWALYQGGGPAVVFLRQNDNTSTHAGSFATFGFAHESGFFTDFKLGGGTAPTLKFAVGYTVRKRNP
jgi:hypothetical protein